jgi:hypothetical protein
VCWTSLIIIIKDQRCIIPDNLALSYFKENEVSQNNPSNKTQSSRRRDNFQQWGERRNSHLGKQMHMHSSRMDSSRKIVASPAPAREVHFHILNFGELIKKALIKNSACIHPMPGPFLILTYLARGVCRMQFL